MSSDNREAWANEELAGLRLGHKARERCATSVLAAVARGVGTRVTDFGEDAAERQQAYGFIENDAISPPAITKAAAAAAIARFDRDDTWCLVPVDGSSLNLADEHGKKGFGRVGGHDSTRGLLVQTAMALSEDGVPLGLLSQVYWARSLTKAAKGAKAARRRLDEKETKYWLQAVEEAEAAGLTAGLGGRMWFLLDRGYDCSVLLEHITTSPNRFTIRGEYNRLLWQGDTDDESQHRTVVEALDAATVIANVTLKVEDTPTRAGRIADLQISVATVEVRLSDPSRRRSVKGSDGKRRNVTVTWPRELTVVRVREVGTTPQNEDPLQWMLWVNWPVTTPQEAIAVANAYTYRWRIEEFHKMWKSGAMKVEETQARSGANVERIVRLSALVACRLLRLTRLARSKPDADAKTEFSRAELAVLKHMDPRSPKQAPRPEKLGSLAWAMAIIADFGGYTGRSSGGPPGPIVLARGMQRLMDRAIGFAAAMEKPD